MVTSRTVGRLMAIDYGRRRCGIAATDPMRIVASAVATVETPKLEAFVKDYCAREQVDVIVIGHPTTVRGEESESMKYITPFVNRLRKILPSIPVEMFDERFTSAIAHRAMIDGGMKKSDRRNKGVVDRIAAVIILNDYLESRQYQDRNTNYI